VSAAANATHRPSSQDPVTEVVIPPAAAPAAQSQSIAAVDQADADPKIARKLAVQTLRASNKTNLLEYLANASSSTAGYPLPQPTDAEMDVLSKADSVSAQWQEEIDLRNAARKYYPALSAVFIQADIQRKMEAPDGGFRFALIQFTRFAGSVLDFHRPVRRLHHVCL